MGLRPQDIWELPPSYVQEYLEIIAWYNEKIKKEMDKAKKKW